MKMMEMLESVKTHPDFAKVGMVLCHNGVVRGTSRDGRRVSGLRIAVDHEKLDHIIRQQKQRDGIVEILVHINEGKDLVVGDDVMYLIVAGDIRDHVIRVLEDTLNAIKQTVTTKTEFFV